MSNDSGKNIATVALVGAVGYGIYSWWKGKEEIPPEKQWVELASTSITVKPSLTYAWILLASKSLSIVPSVTYAWILLASKQFTVVPSITYVWVLLASRQLTIVPSVTYAWVLLSSKSLLVKLSTVIGFKVTIWGIPSDFGIYNKWACYYWNPSTSTFTGDDKWYNTYDNITFTGVMPGGFLAVFLLKDSIVSQQYSSSTFSAVNNGIYQYDVQLNSISKIG